MSRFRCGLCACADAVAIKSMASMRSMQTPRGVLSAVFLLSRCIIGVCIIALLDAALGYLHLRYVFVSYHHKSVILSEVEGPRNLIGRRYPSHLFYLEHPLLELPRLIKV